MHLPTGTDADRSRRQLGGVVVRLAIGSLAVQEHDQKIIAQSSRS